MSTKGCCGHCNCHGNECCNPDCPCHLPESAVLSPNHMFPPQDTKQGVKKHEELFHHRNKLCVCFKQGWRERLEQEMTKIIEAPYRGRFSTSDIRIPMWSTSMLQEKVSDLTDLLQKEISLAVEDEKKRIRHALSTFRTTDKRRYDVVLWRDIILTLTK